MALAGRHEERAVAAAAVSSLALFTTRHGASCAGGGGEVGAAVALAGVWPFVRLFWEDGLARSDSGTGTESCLLLACSTLRCDLVRDEETLQVRSDLKNEFKRMFWL